MSGSVFQVTMVPFLHEFFPVARRSGSELSQKHAERGSILYGEVSQASVNLQCEQVSFATLTSVVDSLLLLLLLLFITLHPVNSCQSLRRAKMQSFGK